MAVVVSFAPLCNGIELVPFNRYLTTISSETIVLVKAQVRVEFTGSDVLEKKKKLGQKLNTNIRLEKIIKSHNH